MINTKLDQADLDSSCQVISVRGVIIFQNLSFCTSFCMYLVVAPALDRHDFLVQVQQLDFS